MHIVQSLFNLLYKGHFQFIGDCTLRDAKGWLPVQKYFFLYIEISALWLVQDYVIFRFYMLAMQSFLKFALQGFFELFGGMLRSWIASSSLTVDFNSMSTVEDESIEYFVSTSLYTIHSRWPPKYSVQLQFFDLGKMKIMFRLVSPRIL